MSTYAYVKLFVADKKNNIISQSKDINVNYMKELLFGSDWPDELEGFNPELPVDITVDDIGYIKVDAIDGEVMKHVIGAQGKEPVIVDEMFDTRQLREEGKVVSEYNSKLFAGKWKKLQRKNENYSIVWVTIEILHSYEEKAKGKIAKSYQELAAKNAIKNSVDYYKLDDDAKDSLNQDINSIEDDIEYEFDRMKAVNQLIGLMDGYKEANEKDWEDNVYAALFLC